LAGPPRKPGVIRDSYEWIDRLVGRGALAEIGSLLAGAAFIAPVWYFGVGLLHRVDALEGSTAVTIGQYFGPVVMAFGAVFGVIAEIRTARSRMATKQVAEAVDKITREAAGASVAGVSVERVAAALKTKVSTDHLTRLVEQQKDKLLIDEDYFRTEVGNLIVDYLQPLPRNAKRLLNRFRVSLLIAHRRGLFTSEPKVTTEQIGKWLVLSERWPQLARSLSAAPEAMRDLEKQAVTHPPQKDESAESATRLNVSQRRTRRARIDPFTESIKALAAFYVGDQDLRSFLDSAPALAAVLPRLVHYGAGELPSAVVTADTAGGPRNAG
jgi:hypothetical protein